MRIGLLIVYAALACACVRGREAEVHIMPAGFRGQVTIFYDVASAPLVQRDGSERLFRVPSSGVMVFQDKVNVGWGLDEAYFFEDAGGKRVSIPGRWTSTIHDVPEIRRDQTVGIRGPVTGRGENLESIPPCRYSVQWYMVGSQADLLDSKTDPDEVVDNLVKTLKPCEGGA